MNETPMGVSQWMNHGKKFGYWDYFFKKEICICAAVIDDTGKVIRGHRHDDCIKRIIASGHKPESGHWGQGFITSRNRYVTREEGRVLQDEAGIESASPDGYLSDTLFSEDLY